MIREFDFDGVRAWEITDGDLSVQLMSWGATILSVKYKGKELALGYKTLAEYKKGDAYIGAIVGRYANRIADGRCLLGGKILQLTRNDGKNHLHGGLNSFDKQLWGGYITGENSVKLVLHSADGDNGYPGDLQAAVTYSIVKGHLCLMLEGETTKDTLYAPTTHVFWKLSEEGVKGVQARVAASSYLPVDEGLIPTGAISSVANTHYDLRKFAYLDEKFDHCFVLRPEPATMNKRIMEAKADGVLLAIKSDFPSMQLYTGSFLNPEKNGFELGEAFAAEPEALPDTPNHPEFGTALLKAGEHYVKHIEYIFEDVK